MSLRSSNKIKIEGGMSSMTDLVFLLLVFFVILSTMAKNEMDVELPSGGESGTSNAKSIKIEIDKENLIEISDKPTTIEDLEMMLLSELKGDKETVIELGADKDSDVGFTVSVLQIAKDNGLKIALMTNN